MVHVLYTTQYATMCARARMRLGGGGWSHNCMHNSARTCTMNNLDRVSLPLLLLLCLSLSLLAQLELSQLHLKDQAGVGWDTTLDTLCMGQK